MTNPTPQSTDDAGQFASRFGDVKDALDAVGDALHNYGPSREEHKDALAQLGKKDKTFYMDALLAFSSYKNNQVEALDEQTLEAVKDLVTDHPDLPAAAHKLAPVLGSSFERLMVAARVTGLVKWTDPTPDAK